MNAEICKKCFENKYRVKNGRIHYDVRTDYQKKKYAIIFFIARIEKFNLNSACCLDFLAEHLFNGRNKAEDIFLEDRECPYYLEHNLFDWSTKK